MNLCNSSSEIPLIPVLNQFSQTVDALVPLNNRNWFRQWSEHTSRTLFSRSSSFSSASLSLTTPSSLLISSAANLSGSTCISFGIRFVRWGKTCQAVSTLRVSICSTVDTTWAVLAPWPLTVHPVSHHMRGLNMGRKHSSRQCQVETLRWDAKFKLEITCNRSSLLNAAEAVIYFKYLQ